MDERRIAVIGAGPSGLTCAKSLLEAGLVPVVYEQDEALGGTWRYKEEPVAPTHSSCYESLRTNVPSYFRCEGWVCPACAWLNCNDTAGCEECTAVPKKDEVPQARQLGHAVPHHEMLEYLQSYARKFDLDQYVCYCTCVTQLERRECDCPQDSDSCTCPRWIVTITSSEGDVTVERFHGVAVCSGHHNDPIIPKWAQQHTASPPVTHSRDYRRPDEYAGKRVLVVGHGISGGEIAREVGLVAEDVVVSSSRVPITKQDAGTMGLLDMIASYWSPPQQVPARTTYSGHLLKPAVVDVEPPRIVHFADGTEDEFDAVILCTGFKISFPFLNETLLRVAENPYRVPLYKHVFPPHLPGLAFLALVSTDGSLHQIAEAQAKWVAAVFGEQTSLPERDRMETEVMNWQRDVERFGVKYRPMQVSLGSYTRTMESLALGAEEL